MIDKPPPFADYIPVATDDVWQKILTGKITAHVYSSEARGEHAPVPISLAQFVIADQAGCNQEFGFNTNLQPFQILWRDVDRRRPATTRRGTRVPHWVYVMRAASASPNADKVAPTKRSTAPQQIRAEAALKALFGDKVPSREQIDDGELLKKVNTHIGTSARPIQRDSLLRAAGRRK